MTDINKLDVRYKPLAAFDPLDRIFVDVQAEKLQPVGKFFFCDNPASLRIAASRSPITLFVPLCDLLINIRVDLSKTDIHCLSFSLSYDMIYLIKAFAKCRIGYWGRSK